MPLGNACYVSPPPSSARSPSPSSAIRRARGGQLSDSGAVLEMAIIEFEDGAIQVDASIVGEGLGIDPSIPTETAITANGDIYVADGYGKDFIIQYDYKGNYIRYFGGRGDKEENLLNAHGICVDHRDKTNPTLIVTSRQQNAFKRFTLEGKYINTIPLPGAWVCRPVINGDYLYSAVLQSSSHLNEQSGFVTILDKDFKVVSNLAGNDPTYSGNKPEEMHQTVKVFQYPHDVCIDDEQNMYVAQWNSGMFILTNWSL